MEYTIEELKEMMQKCGGDLDLTGCTKLAKLPDNLTVGGSLCLVGCTGLTTLSDKYKPCEHAI